ncbi:MAG: 4Fe-4S binding protein [Candidatus Korarchaeota archaeon]|nr:4Fe-4S binding protein [Candidatus Korarchaeota archaeon]NIU84199.1 4Fe-4S binding protein [Candidatus Thorarchaeota archaeon]NIW14347.1 4Fe-4S binding protein [Candidatus Thorarchaeota archaeon]NIW52436.1 4Fe-4S binding protein [Candidatus Korarchaeota archaeon]
MEIILPRFFVILSFFVVSIFVYRPFCRLFCPYGAIASLVAKFSLFKLKKGDTCVNCGKCDAKCPTGNISQKYGECYLCGRCFRVCNVEAIAFC